MSTYVKSLELKNAALIEALQDLVNTIGGGDKACGHDFECSCAFNKAKELLNSETLKASQSYNEPVQHYPV